MNSFLLNDFYTIEKLSNDADISTSSITIKAGIRLNASHAIFKGHFEQMPVMPGVCQTQLIKEVLQQVIQQNLTLTKASNIKYTGMIVPTQHPQFELELNYKLTESGTYNTDAKLFFETTIFMKFKGEFNIAV